MRSLLLLALVALPAATAGTNCKGCTPLDTLTFDKMLRSFPYSIVKFDTAYPYGDKHEEFAKVAVDGADVADLFVGEVGIKDYGEKDNEELGTRYKIEKDDYPVVMVFKKDASAEGGVSSFRFEADKEGGFTAANLKAFLRQKTGIYLPLAGCIEEMDKLAERLLAGEESKKLLSEAETELGKVSAKNKRRAELYVKIMKKVAAAAAGEDFAATETARTKKLLEGKITEAKKTELQEKLNILKSFSRPDAQGAKAKEEL